MPLEGGAVKIREVAVQLGVTLAYIYGLVRAERLPGAHKRDGVWCVPKTAVDEYMKRRGQRASSRKEFLREA
jgi:excisionase family DNA binding protein